jgi:hypothetical protein
LISLFSFSFSVYNPSEQAILPLTLSIRSNCAGLRLELVSSSLSPVEEHRADAVGSMVPAGAICQLQKQVNDLQAQLARAHAELSRARAHLLALLFVEVAAASSPAYCAVECPSA